MFRQQPKAGPLRALRKAVEEERDFTQANFLTEAGVDVHCVVALLCEWLHLLPDPILGSGAFAPLCLVFKVEDDAARVKEIRRLILAHTPRHSLPVALRVLSLLQQLLLPDNAEQNGLTLVAVGVLFGPFFCRPDAKLPLADDKQFHFLMLRTASMAAAIIQFLLLRQAEVLEGLEGQLEEVEGAREGRPEAQAHVFFDDDDEDEEEGEEEDEGE